MNKEFGNPPLVEVSISLKEGMSHKIQGLPFEVKSHEIEKAETLLNQCFCLSLIIRFGQNIPFRTDT